MDRCSMVYSRKDCRLHVAAINRRPMGNLRARLRRSWLGANRFHLFFLMILLALFNSAAAVFGGVIILFFYLRSVFKARLPIDSGGSYTRETRTYHRAGSQELKLDIHYPKKPASLYPVVFFAHGGGWISGFRNQPNNISWCRYLASRGFAAVSIDYRYGLTSTMEDILSDYSAALDYLRDHALELRLAGDTIILMGLSAGGHLALLFSAYYTYMKKEQRTSGIRGVVAYYAPAVLEDIFSPEEKSIFARVAAMATLKGTPRTAMEAYRYYSPISWISEAMVPVVIVHGKEDTVVPFQSSVALNKKLEEAGVFHTFLVHPEGDHGFDTKRKDLKTMGILVETVRAMKGMLPHDH